MKSTANFNHVLTTAASEYAVNEAEYAAPALAPVFRAGVQAATFLKWKRENLLNVPKLHARGSGAPYPRLNFEIGDDTFATRDYGLELPLDDRQKAIYANAIDADRGKVARGVRVLALNKERRVHALATGGGVPTSAAGTKWNAAGGDPIGDVDAIKEVIHDNCGLEANLAIIPRDVFIVLKEHPAILDKIKYTQRGIVTADIVAAVLGLGRIVVAGATQNLNNEGQAISITKVWADSVIIAHVNPVQDLETPTFIRTFAWSGYTRATGGEFAVETYRENNPPATVHQLKHDVDEKIVAAACGYHLSDVLS